MRKIIEGSANTFDRYIKEVDEVDLLDDNIGGAGTEEMQENQSGKSGLAAPPTKGGVLGTTETTQTSSGADNMDLFDLTVGNGASSNQLGGPSGLDAPPAQKLGGSAGIEYNTEFGNFQNANQLNGGEIPKGYTQNEFDLVNMDKIQN